MRHEIEKFLKMHKFIKPNSIYVHRILNINVKKYCMVLLYIEHIKSDRNNIKLTIKLIEKPTKTNTLQRDILTTIVYNSTTDSLMKLGSLILQHLLVKQAVNVQAKKKHDIYTNKPKKVRKKKCGAKMNK